MTGIDPGFQAITVDTYSQDNPSEAHSSNLVTVRVGDREIGTFEDTITVLSDDTPPQNPIVFPTGITDKFYISSGTGTIHQISNGKNRQNFDPFNEEAITDTTAADFLFGENVTEFSKEVVGRLLNISYKIGETTYSLKAVIPQ